MIGLFHCGIAEFDYVVWWELDAGADDAGNDGETAEKICERMVRNFADSAWRFVSMHSHEWLCYLMPMRFVRFEVQDQRGAGFGVGVLLEEQEDGWCVFDSAAEAEPGVQRNLADRAGGDIAQIDGDYSEAAGLDEQIGGAQGLVEILAADPKEFAQIDSGSSGGERIEAVARIDQGADFAISGALGERGEEQAGAAGAGSSADFGHGAARKAAGEEIDFGDAKGDQLENVAVAIGKGRRDATAEIGFDLGAESGDGASGHGDMGGEKGGGAREGTSL